MGCHDLRLKDYYLIIKTSFLKEIINIILNDEISHQKLRFACAISIIQMCVSAKQNIS